MPKKRTRRPGETPRILWRGGKSVRTGGPARTGGDGEERVPRCHDETRIAGLREEVRGVFLSDIRDQDAAREGEAQHAAPEPLAQARGL